MKLILCSICGAIFSLKKNRHKECDCGKSSGEYIDDLHARIYGDHAIPIGFQNSSFDYALRNRPEAGQGVEFKAFVIAQSCPTITYEVDFFD